MLGRDDLRLEQGVGESVVKRRTTVMTLVCSLLLSAAAAGKTPPTVIFKGTIEEDRLFQAIGVDEEHDLATLGRMTGDGTTLVVYRGYPGVSSAEPLAINVDGRITLFNEPPSVSTAPPTVLDLARSATTGERIIAGARCRDGARVTVTGDIELTRMLRGWRGCGSHRGVDHWQYKGVRDEEAVVAAICRDYRLVSGKGERCAPSSSVLVQIQNRDY